MPNKSPAHTTMNVLTILKKIFQDKEVLDGILEVFQPSLISLIEDRLKTDNCLITKSPGDDLISVGEALKLTTPPIGRTTLHNWTKSGKIKAYNIGRRVFYSKQAMIDFLISVEKKTSKTSKLELRIIQH